MADTFRKAAQWLGLVEDDRYNDRNSEELTEEVSGNETWSEDEPSAAITPINRSQELAPIGVTTVTQQRPHKRIEDLTRIITVHPRTYNEARTIGEHFRDGVPVIMNLTDMDEADAKRLVDFAAGLIFGLHGSIEKITRNVFLLSPPNVEVTAEDKARIAHGGFFNQS